jgi:hypothetical protein
MDKPALAVDVARLEVARLVEAEPERVDAPEEVQVAVGVYGVHDAVYLVAAQHVGQAPLGADLQALERRPLPRLGVPGEEADAVEGHLDGGSRELRLVHEEEEVLAQLCLTETVGRGGEVLGELTDCAQVGLLGALAQTGQLQILAHALTQGRSPGRAHGGFLSQR